MTVVARARAALTLSWRRPSMAALPVGRAVAPLVIQSLIWFGVAVGLACNSSAAAAETTAVAWDVPLPLNSVVPTRAVG
jgi:hypothetical protein